MSDSDVEHKRLQIKLTIMKNIHYSVQVTTGVLMFFLFLCGFDDTAHIIMSLFIILNIMIIWMVYSVLRHGEPSAYTFSERFYEDKDNKTIPDDDEM